MTSISKVIVCSYALFFVFIIIITQKFISKKDTGKLRQTQSHTESKSDAFCSWSSFWHSSSGPKVFTRFCIRTLPFSKPWLCFSATLALLRTDCVSVIDMKVFLCRLKIGGFIFATVLFLIVASFADNILDWQRFSLLDWLVLGLYLLNLLFS